MNEFVRWCLETAKLSQRVTDLLIDPNGEYGIVNQFEFLGPDIFPQLEEIIAGCKMNLGEKVRFRTEIEKMRCAVADQISNASISSPITAPAPLNSSISQEVDPWEEKCRQVYDFTSTPLRRDVVMAIVKNTKSLEDAVALILPGDVNEQLWLDREKKNFKTAQLQQLSEMLGVNKEDEAKWNKVLECYDKNNGNLEIVYRKLENELKVLECGICMEEFLVEEFFTMECPSSHRFCRTCIRTDLMQHVSSGNVPVCPGKECRDGKGFVFHPSQPAMDFIQVSATDQKQVVMLFRNVGFAEAGAVGCPVADCEGFVIPNRVDNIIMRERADCQACKATFCPVCQKTPYHYRTTCDEANKIKINWEWWLAEGKANHGVQSADQKAAFKKSVKVYKSEMAKRAQEKALLDKRFEDLQRDEQWKAQHCRHCPACGRAVEKLQGCDAMVCGTDAHGGNRQNGCGQSFRWSTAAPYQSNNELPQAIADRNKLLEGLKAPEKQKEVRHGLFQCTLCNNPITGLRFCCINCEVYDLCQKCESGNNGHPKTHAFQIIQEGFELDGM